MQKKILAHRKLLCQGKGFYPSPFSMVGFICSGPGIAAIWPSLGDFWACSLLHSLV